MENSETNQERRSSSRFPIERDLRYKVLGEKMAKEICGEGRTLNMSSGGVLFTADVNLPVGKRVEVSISWPAQLDSKVALRLVASGRVIRSGEGQTAIQIQRYEFRTQGIGHRSTRFGKLSWKQRAATAGARPPNPD